MADLASFKSVSLNFSPIVDHPHVSGTTGHFCNESFNAANWKTGKIAGDEFAKKLVQAIYDLDEKEINWASPYRYNKDNWTRNLSVQKTRDNIGAPGNVPAKWPSQ